MKTKQLYILVSDSGDGSYHTQYTFSTELVNKLQQAYYDGRMGYDNGIGVDGDGFHYDELQVPESCTYESLGIVYPLPDDYADEFDIQAE